METSASPLAASAALAQRVAPSAASASAGPGERFQTLTRWPALIRRSARPLPIAPRPITPTSMAFSKFARRPALRGAKRRGDPGAAAVPGLLRLARNDGVGCHQSVPPDPPQMRCVERSRVFEAVAERPIKADMSEPDQRDPFARDPVRPSANDEKDQRPDRRMQRVVPDRASPRREEIGQKGQVRSKEEEDEEQPRAAESPIEKGGADRQRRPFQPQDEPRAALNGAQGRGAHAAASASAFFS